MTAKELASKVKNIGFEAKVVANDIVEVSLKNRQVGMMEVETEINREIPEAKIELVRYGWSGVWVCLSK